MQDLKNFLSLEDDKEHKGNYPVKCLNKLISLKLCLNNCFLNLVFLEAQHLATNSIVIAKGKENMLNQHQVGNYPMQCCPRGPTQIKMSFLP